MQERLQEWKKQKKFTGTAAGKNLEVMKKSINYQGMVLTECKNAVKDMTQTINSQNTKQTSKEPLLQSTGKINSAKIFQETAR